MCVHPPLLPNSGALSFPAGPSSIFDVFAILKRYLSFVLLLSPFFALFLSIFPPYLSLILWATVFGGFEFRLPSFRFSSFRFWCFDSSWPPCISVIPLLYPFTSGWTEFVLV